MALFALADLHLSLSVPSKTMEAFGWQRYQERIFEHWHESVTDEDLVLIAGDISWAMRLEEALIDLEWIDRLPGTKLLLKGNHDYWWPSLSKFKSLNLRSLHMLHNVAFHWNECCFAGTRLWDSKEYNEEIKDEDEAIYVRELQRLENNLQLLDPKAKHRIALTHYPPIAPDLKPSRASLLFERYGVEHVIFGHLHGIGFPFGEARGVHYHLTAADYLEFKPLKIL